jgi:signal transduction histidine kinase
MLSTLAELNELTVLDEIRVVALHIEGTVWWSSKSEGRVILSDDTTAVQLELDLPCEVPELGARLMLEGNCTAIKTRDTIMLSSVPVVENGGLHAPEEQSGKVYLKAGRHPIRVAWFNRTDRYGLKVSYEGPDISRQPVQDEVLFHLPADAAPGTTNYMPGLRYRYCEGAWWKHLPNFDHIAAVKTGQVSNFNIGVRSRNDHVGLQFTGHIDVPQDGDYTFYVQSDDGSRLFIGDSSLRIYTVGHEALPLPNPSDMGMPAAEEPEFQRSIIEGTVASFHRSQGGVEVDVMTDEGLVRLIIAEDSSCSYTLRPQNRMRAAGVSRRIRNLAGSLSTGDFFVQHWDDTEQTYIVPTIWSEYPVRKIGDLPIIESSNGAEPVVHLEGSIISLGAGQPMALEDDSGRIILDGSIPDDPVGRFSSVLGRLSMDGSDQVLRCAEFLRLEEPGTETGSLPLLTTAEQVSQLSLEEATRGYPVRLRGVITSVNEFMGAVLHDSTRGIYLWLTMPEGMDPEEWTPFALQVGDYCEVEGVTMPYGFDPYLPVTRLQVLGAGTLPEPVKPTWDQLINGSLHCNYVELEGVVSSIKDTTLALLTRDGRINVKLNPIGATLPQNVLGATIRLRGCLLAEWDAASHRVVVGKIYLDQHRVTLVHPAPEDPFAIPLKSVGELLQFDPEGGSLRRVKVSGILLHKDEQMSYMMDGENGLRFAPEKAIDAQIGDHVEVVGFSDLSGPSALLRNALVRRIGSSELPSPHRLNADDLLRDEYDATMVQVDGTLLSVSRRQDGSVLEMQSGLRRFLAIMEDPIDMDELPPPGSQLELAGVFMGLGGNRVLGRPIDSFQLHLNSIHDIRVLSRPSWWTFGRLMLVVFVLILVLIAALVWIEMLHRKVEQRTQQLGTQIRQRQRAEQQREIEHERARLAHDLHDDLGAGLTEVNMLSSLLKNPSTPAEKKERYATEMNELAMRMVTSLDEIVWAENPGNDTLVSLAGYFGAYAQRFMELASVGCGLDVEEDFPDYPLDPKFRRELFLAFKEALTNVIKHADATKVWLRIRILDKNIAITVSDDGRGVLPDEYEPGADGLVSMRKRLVALGGDCEILSDPEKGTTVCLKAPLQEVGT